MNKVLLVFLFCITFVFGQENLVHNPSFEDNIRCPRRFGNLEADTKYWSMSTQGTSDYFHTCSKTMGVPKNFNGNQLSKFGEGFAGLYLYAPDDYREYLQVQLKQPLVKDKAYTVSFYISLAERSNYALNTIGVLLASKAVKQNTIKVLSKSKLYAQTKNTYTFLEIKDSNFYKETKDWTLVSKQFVAKGGEEFLIIGNFNANRRTHKFTTGTKGNKGAYYYVDMVSIKRILPKKKKEEKFALNKSYIFKSVLFKFDKDELRESAKKEINELVEYLKVHDQLKITIHGHTDNVGGDLYNKHLSEKRCKVVMNYIVGNGVLQKRINFVAHGSNSPIAENVTPEGRQKNRRVAFVIVE